MNLILLGAPGSGKGTQAEQLQTAFNLTLIASGDLFREHLDNKTELGLQAAAFMARGELVPDGVTIAMVRERVEPPDVRGGVIFDGFPRTLAQADALDAMMAALGRSIDGVLCLDVPDEDIVARLAGRLVCHECPTVFHRTASPFRTCLFHRCSGEFLYRRDDDQPEIVRARLSTFHGRTGPLVERFRSEGRLVTVRGSGSIEDVTQAMLDAARALAERGAGSERPR